MSTTWTRRITVTYREEKRSETSETTTTAILVEGPPLAPSSQGLPDEKYVDEIMHLLVPMGQEVILSTFTQPFHGLQLLTFRTICDHGD